MHTVCFCSCDYCSRFGKGRGQHEAGSPTPYIQDASLPLACLESSPLETLPLSIRKAHRGRERWITKPYSKDGVGESGTSALCIYLQGPWKSCPKSTGEFFFLGS